MNTQTERRAPSATASISGLSKHIDGVTISAAVNTLGQITVIGVPDGASADTVNEIGSTEILTALKAFQNSKYTGQSNTGRVRINDGAGNTMTFNGLISSPIHQVGVGVVAFGTQMTSLAAKVQALRTSIYAGINNAYLKEYSDDIKGSSYAELMSTTLIAMVKDWQNAVAQKALLFTKEENQIREQLHQYNIEPMRIWLKILEDSKATTSSEALKNMTEDVRAAIIRYILQVYSAGTGDFFQTILRFCEAFHLVYVPNIGNLNATYGVLIDAKTMVGKAFAGTCSPVAINMQLGEYSMIPVTGVLVRAPGAAVLKEASGDEKNQMPEIHSVFWPPSAAQNPGCCAEIAPPPWLPNIVAVADQQVQVFAAETNLDPTQFHQNLTQIKVASLALQVEAFKAIMTEWAQGHYLDLAVAGETVILNIPLDISWAVGCRYEVKKKGGGTMFKGFLAQANHNFNINAGGGQASTDLVFTHVEVLDFELPDKGKTGTALQGASLQASSGL